MKNIDSTPEFVAATYDRMSKNMPILRERLGRPLGLSDKVLLSHLDDPQSQELNPGSSYLKIRPDRVMLQDVLGQTAMLQFMQTLKPTVAVPTTIHCDHLIQARSEGVQDLRESLSENDEVYNFLKSAAAKYGAGFWGPGAGIIHQVNLENYAFPGSIIIGTDSHTPNGGGLGSFSVGVGGADAVEAMAGLPWELLYPKKIGVQLTGEMSGWTSPKDVILYLAGHLTVSGGTNSTIEYFGPGARSISCTGKATITNMGAELGATTSIFPYDERMARYLSATDRGNLANLANNNKDILTADKEVVDDPESYFDILVKIDLSELEPHVVGPHSPDRARPLSQLAQEVKDESNAFVNDISATLIGSCTNSSYEDMSRAADVAEQAIERGVRAKTPLMVTPGSERVRATIERDGQMASLRSIGATVLANACGPCIGQWKRSQDVSTKPNSIVTSYNRNFPARNDGQQTTMNFIASPEITTAFALAGSLSFNPITDELKGDDGVSFRLIPPAPAPEVPAKNFAGGREQFSSPPDDGSTVTVDVDPNSKRIQILKPWDAWDGEDIIDSVILLKAQGKCTTDHISPAGVWLSLRGHLDKFSDNMFMGAANAFTKETGKGTNLISGETGKAVSQNARDYKAAGQKWIVIGDDNYGEGSSREHAALSPRLLGGSAVIARSFARIHETNLKKQGLLALTFDDRNDYSKIREDDRVDITGLASLSPGKKVSCTIHHSGGSSETIHLNHTYSESQIEWFRKGSFLNLFHSS
ncbi:MAG: aconitate hydratase [Chloroflexota bacterium]|uniref:Aconitase A/isopropylmalate dehydratase small subunit swivel domain-containing protein n=1 Tax=marine metagenome TaxID=408172 RepID=A0A381SZX0_9ZZZZ|nr:aconitate hydratase [Chloroflexota bacterium]|tara:strand:+ start:1354 stop:3630 length:2277 start_codon:yes stop_codon:yes gene_type:complete